MSVIYPDSPEINHLLVHEDVLIISDTKERVIKVTDVKSGATMTLADRLDKPSALALQLSSQSNGKFMLLFLVNTIKFSQIFIKYKPV
jgi:hypothetical protein